MAVRGDDLGDDYFQGNWGGWVGGLVFWRIAGFGVVCRRSRWVVGRTDR